MKRYSFLLGLLFVANSLFAQETLTIKDINLELIKCPAGSFMMGSPENEQGHHYEKEILHEVKIPAYFYIGKFEITQNQYVRIMGQNPTRQNIDKNCPVNDLEWKDVLEFCKRLNNKYAKYLPTGYKFDVPTDEQWEYACRAGTTTTFNNGKNLLKGDDFQEGLLDDCAWTKENTYSNDRRSIYPVGQKKPNAWGIYDMHGNVEELCKYIYFSESSQKNVESFLGKGGDYYSDLKDCRAAKQDLSYGLTGGLRIAIVPITKEETAQNKDNDKIIPYEDLNLEMVECPAGSFMMGSSDDLYKDLKKRMDSELEFQEVGLKYSEKIHKVNISKPFKIGKYEIITKQYEAVMGKYDGSDYDTEVACYISWLEAKKFCLLLNLRYSNNLPKGYIFDLPTEAQWEYACRAGTTTDFNNGKNITDEKADKCSDLDEIAWYGANRFLNKLYPKGQKKPNAWGIYDMHGNAGELCRDNFTEIKDGEVTDPFYDSVGIYGYYGITQEGKERVFLLDKNKDIFSVRKGGIAIWESIFCRSAYRDFVKISKSSFYSGFRVALVPENLNDFGIVKADDNHFKCNLNIVENKIEFLIALQMYRFDHTDIDISTIKLSTLLKEGYLDKSFVTISSDCDYCFAGDITKEEGQIVCKKHSFEIKNKDKVDLSDSSADALKTMKDKPVTKTPIPDSSSNSSIKEAPKAETSSTNNSSSTATSSSSSNSNISSSTTQQKNSASYDTKEYKPVQLKPIKTHPKVVVPEELELEP